MAKLASQIQFTGSLEGLSAYRMKGVEGIILRAKYGPSKEDINTKPNYENNRRFINENRGRAKAVRALMKAFEALKPLSDADTAGHLNKLLTVIQKGDTTGIYGQRAVLLSQFPHLLQGFHLTKHFPFNDAVRGEPQTTLDRATRSASVTLPHLLPGVTCFPPPGGSFFRIAVTLGVAPNMVYTPLGYATVDDYSNCYSVSTETAWFPSGKAVPATSLSLALPYTPPGDAYSLVLAIGMQLGITAVNGNIEMVRERTGSGKILAAR
jgi:hypothetical protein